MNTMTRLIVVAAFAAAGCAGSDTPAPESPTSAHAEEQAPTQVAGYEARSEQAPKDGKKAIDPSTPIGQGMMLLEGGKLDEAVAHFEQLTGAEPDNAKAWQLYGYSLHAAGRLDEALAIHQRAATFEAVAPVALYNVACVHSLQGNADAAFEALERAIDAGFDGAEYLHKDEDLANIRNDARFASVMGAAEENARQHEAEHGDAHHEHAE